MEILMKNSINSLYALAIVAHPDDESFLMAGTTMKFEAEGKTVGVLCATRGEKGADRLNRELTEKDMAEIRTEELQQACSMLHCECRGFFEYPDGGLDQVDFEQLVTKLISEININQPKIVLTFGEEGISGHKDHITIGRAALEASKRAEPRPEEVWKASIPASQADNFYEHMEKRKVHRMHFMKNRLQGVADDKLTRVNVEKYRGEKLQAIAAHKSQHVPSLIWPKFLEYEYFEIVKL